MEVESYLMHKLVEDGIYQAVQVYDFQGMCEETGDTKELNAAISLLNVRTKLSQTYL